MSGDVRAVYIPATTLASQLGTPGLANMVLVGKLMKECPELAGGSIEEVLHKVISARHADLFESNLNAVKKGMEY
ncbi:MAG: 2-oxoacid:acceptor oxidoreductase family protein [Firmicutes bacterium]|nr:2-oxoacid:acceptor oxidoreductase family protein [Bacillota bacterium]